MKIILLVVGVAIIALILFLVFFADKKDTKGLPAKESAALERVKKKDQGLIDYDVYAMRTEERILYTAAAAVIIAITAYIFYRSYTLSLLLTPLSYCYPRLKTREIIAQRKRELNLQFKEALFSLSSSLSAGKSLENALRDVLKDLAVIYPDPDTYILGEFQYIIRKTEMNVAVEEAFADFSQRSHLEDIESFSDIITISKRTGGNIIEIIKTTSNIITDKLQVKQEIETLLAQRKLEQKILNVMPIVMIILLSWSTGDYMVPVFYTMAGRFVMTIAILLLLLAYAISRKLMDIEV